MGLQVTFPFKIQPSFNLWLEMENSSEVTLEKRNMQNYAI